MSDIDPYEILGVNRDASQEEIDKAYREKAKEHHPDLGGDMIVFKNLALSKEVLSDPEKRQWYDQTGQADVPDEVRVILAQLVEAAFLSDREIPNPIKAMCDEADRARASHKSQADRSERKLKRVEKKLARFLKLNEKSKNGAGRALIAAQMRAKVEGLRLEIHNHRRGADVMTAVLVHLNDLTYAPESPEFGFGSPVSGSFFSTRAGW
jgi:curved DNA-binding protein CbpA